MKTNLLKLNGHRFEAVIAGRQVSGRVRVENGLVWLENNIIGQNHWVKGKYDLIWLAGDGEREALERNQIISLKIFSRKETFKLWWFEEVVPLLILICAVAFLGGLFVSIVTGLMAAKIVMLVGLVGVLVNAFAAIANKNHIF